METKQGSATAGMADRGVNRAEIFFKNPISHLRGKFPFPWAVPNPRGTVAERRSLIGELSLSHARSVVYG